MFFYSCSRRHTICALVTGFQSCALPVTYTATVRDPDGAALTYAATITATDATLDFTVEARADSDFTTNRLGFCVLHPAHLAGSPLSVEHGDGSVERADRKSTRLNSSH